MSIENGPVLIKPVDSANLFSTFLVAKSGTAVSEAFRTIDLDVFALLYQADSIGTPNVKLELQQSADNTNWFIPDTFATINASLTDKNLHGIKLSPIPVQYLRVKATELTGSLEDTSITVKLSVQKRFTV